MTRKWLDDPDNKWEALDGNFPVACLDIHPSDKFISMQVIAYNGITNERAAIWDVNTKKIVWCPENASALCWIENGTELLVIERIYQPSKEKPSLYATATQNEYKYFMRRLSWPALDTISSIELNFPLGWIIDVVPSPTDKLVCFVWQDQCESGIEFVSWQQSELKQLPDIGFYGNSNRIQGPVFSSDGTTLAMSFGVGFWWAETPEGPSLGGDFNVGCLIWSETGSGSYNRIDINVSIPNGWKPRDPEDILHNEFLSKPEFVCKHEIKIQLPTNEERIIPLYA